MSRILLRRFFAKKIKRDILIIIYIISCPMSLSKLQHDSMSPELKKGICFSKNTEGDREKKEFTQTELEKKDRKNEE